MPLKNPKPIAELARPTPDANVISRDSETYKRVYDLLEEHTYSWITDAWRKRPALDAIKVEMLRQISTNEIVEMVENSSPELDMEKALAMRDRRAKHVLVHINDKSTLILKDIADAIIEIIGRHAHP